MENPANDVAYLLTRLLNPTTPDAQTSAILKYFTHDASLSHPLCFIDSSHNSRERIIKAYIFLYLITPACTAKIRRQSFNDVKGKMSLEIEITPLLRGVNGVSGMMGTVGWGRGRGWMWEPTIPMHMFLTLRRDVVVVGPWRVQRQEVMFQPIDVLQAFRLDWVANVVYYFLWLLIMTVVLGGQTVRMWTHKDFSIHREIKELVWEGYDILIVPPVTTMLWAAKRGKTFLNKRIAILRWENAVRMAILRMAWRATARKTVENVVVVGQTGDDRVVIRG